MDDVVRDVLPQLLKSAGFATVRMSWNRLTGGRNNRTYRVETPDGPVLLKQYYRDGGWDRLAAESRFLLFCAEHGIECVPRLLAEDATSGLALHSWVDGQQLAADSITGSDIGAAAAFLKKLDRASRESPLSQIPPARDAALCLEDFFRSPRERLKQLHEALLAHPNELAAAEALAFYEKELFPAWEKMSEIVYADLAGEKLTEPFPMEEMFVSPSDIGFHNTLRSRDGELFFLDFEYAGLDSRIKAEGDLTCQPNMPLLKNDKWMIIDHIKRGGIFKNILTLTVFKFCCIILNDFKKSDVHRRDFALDIGGFGRLREQLCRARKYYMQYCNIIWRQNWNYL